MTCLSIWSAAGTQFKPSAVIPIDNITCRRRGLDENESRLCLSKEHVEKSVVMLLGKRYQLVGDADGRRVVIALHK